MHFPRLKETSKALFQGRWQVPLAGAAGGFCASAAHWPLPWMLGSLLAVIALRCLSRVPPQVIPLNARRLGLCIVGSGIGLHFTREVLAQVSGHWPLILIGACCTLLLALLGIALLRRGGVEKPTAFFASLPGGANEMVMLGLKHGADPARVAAAHSLRLLLVVLTVPAAFSWYLPNAVRQAPFAAASVYQFALLLGVGLCVSVLWSRLRQPNPWMLGGLCTSAALSVLLNWHVSLPPGVGAFGQWLLGCGLGCRSFFRSAPRFLGSVLLATVFSMLATVALVFLIARLVSADPLSLTLGMMPGGIAELTLTAESLHLSVALVTALQVLRLLLLVFLAAPLYRLWSRLG